MDVSYLWPAKIYILISEKVTSYCFDHVPVFIMSLFNVDFIMILSCDFFRTDASSAKRVMSDPICSVISYKKRSGPSIEPWGTPAMTGSDDDAFPFKTTYWCPSDKYDWNHISSDISIPICFNLNKSPSFQILSKALDISRNTIPISFLSFRPLYILCTSSTRRVIAKSLSLKTEFALFSKLFSVQYLNIFYILSSPVLWTNLIKWKLVYIYQVFGLRAPLGTGCTRADFHDDGNIPDSFIKYICKRIR